MKANQVDCGFLGAPQSYTIKPVERNLYSYSNFFNQSKKELTRVLQEKVDEMRGLKFKLSFLGYFHFGTLLRATPKEEKNYRSGIYQVLSHEEIKEAVNDAIDELGEEINSFVQHKSGWIFHSNIKIVLNIYRYNPIRGGSYIPLPSIIGNKKACLNIKNNDDKCFLWSVLAGKYPKIKNSGRQSVYLDHAKEFGSWNRKYPMKLSDIPKFEQQFNLLINVYRSEIKFESNN